MSRFKIWLENQEQVEDKLKSIFTAAKGELVGGSGSKQLTIGLSDLETDSGGKGVLAAQDILKDTFSQLKSLGIPEFISNVDETIHWLTGISSGKVTPGAADQTAGGLLLRLFGKELYSKFEAIPDGFLPKDKSEPETPPQQPPAPQQPQEPAPQQMQMPMAPQMPQQGMM